MLLSKQKKERHFSRPSRHHGSEIWSGPIAEKSMWYYYFAIGSSRKINLIIRNIYTLAHNIILHIRDQKQNIFLFPYNIIIELCSFTVAKNVRVFLIQIVKPSWHISFMRVFTKWCYIFKRDYLAYFKQGLLFKNLFHCVTWMHKQ